MKHNPAVTNSISSRMGVFQKLGVGTKIIVLTPPPTQRQINKNVYISDKTKVFLLLFYIYIFTFAFYFLFRPFPREKKMFNQDVGKIKQGDTYMFVRAGNPRLFIYF